MFMFVFIGFDLFSGSVSGVIFSPSAVFLCISVVAFSIFFVFILFICETVGPFPAISVAFVFIEYSVFAFKFANVSESCHADHSFSSIVPFLFVSIPIAYCIFVLSIPEPSSVWLDVILIVFVVVVPVGAVSLGAVLSSHIAYNVTIPLFTYVRFLTVAPGLYAVPFPSGCVFQFINVYPFLTNANVIFEFVGN